MPPLKLLHDHGVEVFGGSDNIRDAWSPFGNGDMLERVHTILGHGLEVLGGFIVGFDNDPRDVFELQFDFIQFAII